MSRVLRTNILKDIERILNEQAGGAYEAGGGATGEGGDPINIDEKLEAFKKYLIAEKKVDPWNETEWKYFATDYAAAQKKWPIDKQFKIYQAADDQRIDAWVESIKNWVYRQEWKQLWSGIFGILVNCGYEAVEKTRSRYNQTSQRELLELANLWKADTDMNNVRHVLTLATYPNIIKMDRYWQSYIGKRLPIIDRKYGISTEFAKVCQEQPEKCIGSPSKPVEQEDVPQDPEDKAGKIFFVKTGYGLQRWDFDNAGKTYERRDQSGKLILDPQQEEQARKAKEAGLPAPGQPGSSAQNPMSLEQFNNYVNPNVAQPTKESFIPKENKPLLKEQTPPAAPASQPTATAADPKTRNPQEGTLFVKDSDGSIKQVQYQNYQRVRVLDANNQPSELAGDKAAAEASGAAGKKGQFTICTGEPDLIPNLQRWLIYAKGQKLNLDGVFGPQTWNALYKVDQQGAGTQITDKTKICPFLRSKKAVYTNEYTAKINADAKLKSQESKINTAYNAAVARNTTGGATAPGQPSATVKPAGQAKLFESYEQFYDNKKIKDADLLFEKLIKNISK